MTLRSGHVLASILAVTAATIPLDAPAAQQRDPALQGVWRFVEEVDRRK